MEWTLFKILKCVVCDSHSNLIDFPLLNEKEWEKLYLLAKEQGVAAVAYEGIQKLPKEKMPPRPVLMKWFSRSGQIEKQMQKIHHLCERFGELMSENGLKCMALKGVAISRYYSHPLHREFGDFDCYLFEIKDDGLSWEGCYEKGNSVSEEKGYSTDRYYYKHSHIAFHGMEVENHQFALPIKDGDDVRDLEKELRRLVVSKDQLMKDTGSCLYVPSADFNALFLTAHAMNHFLYESIKIRHLLDWALFLKHEQNHVDWDNFWQWCDRMHYTRFVLCLNRICRQYLGLQLHPKAHDKAYDERHTKNIIEDLSERILRDAIKGDHLYAQESYPLGFRFALACRYLKSYWKFQKVYQYNAFSLLLKRFMRMFVKDVSL